MILPNALTKLFILTINFLPLPISNRSNNKLTTMLEVPRWWVRDHMRGMDFFNLPNPSCRTKLWGLFSL
jgi:hypothetical protein